MIKRNGRCFVITVMLLASSLPALADGPDFDGDGFDDLAVGVPADTAGLASFAGSVHVIYGSSGGLTDDGDQVWHQNQPGINGSAQKYDGFGRSIAWGDFDRDGFDDLAVGMTGDDADGVSGGAVAVLYGSSSGLKSSGDQLWHQDVNGIAGNAEFNDQFGYAIEAGDFDGDGFDDLAIGIVNDKVGSLTAGSVLVLYGSSAGLRAAHNRRFHLDSDGMLGEPDHGDMFGSALAAGDFDGDGRDDLAIGAHREEMGTAYDHGVVHILYGSGSGLRTNDNQIWHQDKAGVIDSAEELDFFGEKLASGDFDRDGHDDLAIGVPREEVSSENDHGAVHILYGSSGGLTAAGDELWHQDSPGVQNSAEFGDLFGSALVGGDFDDDGRDDLAVGVPHESLKPGEDSHGAAHVFYGSNSGLTAGGDRLWHQDRAGVRETAEANENFAFSLACGDFNGDGADDLAAGVPSETVKIPDDATVSHVRVTLHGFNHVWAADVDIKLVGPNGVAVLLMSDAGETATEVTLAFEDSAAGPLPQLGALQSGTYKPTNYGAVVDPFPAPAPAGGGTSLAAFNGISPIGTWSLYIVDDLGAAAGSLEGWTLHLGSVVQKSYYSYEGDITIPQAGQASQYPVAITFDQSARHGAVHVLYGDKGAGIQDGGDQVWHRNSPGIAGVLGGNFGDSM